MTNLTNTLKKIAGAATVAVVMGATAFSAAPAQAQTFHFGVGSGNGNGPNFSFGIGNDDHRPGRACMSERQLRGEIARQGYRNVRVDNVGRFRAEARGVRGGWLYRLTVNSCTGDIIGRDRLRRA